MGRRAGAGAVVGEVVEEEEGKEEGAHGARRRMTKCRGLKSLLAGECAYAAPPRQCLWCHVSGHGDGCRGGGPARALE